MLRGYRLLIFAACIGLALIAFGLGVALSSDYSDEDRYQSYRYASDKPEEASGLRKADTKAFEYRTPCSSPEGQQESELCAQWRAAKAAEDSAFWAKLGFWATIGGMAGLFFTITQGRQALARAADANRIAQDAAAYANRAWLRLNVGPIITFFEDTNENSVCLRVGTTVENYGQEPATFVSREVIFIYVPGPFHLGSELARLISKTRVHSFFGKTIYQGEEKPIDTYARCVMPVHSSIGVGEPGPYSTPQNYIGVAVFYSSGGDERVYYVAQFFQPSSRAEGDEGQSYYIQALSGECHGELRDSECSGLR